MHMLSGAGWARSAQELRVCFSEGPSLRAARVRTSAGAQDIWTDAHGVVLPAVFGSYMTFALSRGSLVPGRALGPCRHFLWVSRPGLSGGCKSIYFWPGSK